MADEGVVEPALTETEDRPPSAAKYREPGEPEDEADQEVEQSKREPDSDSDKKKSGSEEEGSDSKSDKKEKKRKKKKSKSEEKSKEGSDSESEKTEKKKSGSEEEEEGSDSNSEKKKKKKKKSKEKSKSEEKSKGSDSESEKTEKKKSGSEEGSDSQSEKQEDSKEGSDSESKKKEKKKKSKEKSGSEEKEESEKGSDRDSEKKEKKKDKKSKSKSKDKQKSESKSDSESEDQEKQKSTEKLQSQVTEGTGATPATREGDHGAPLNLTAEETETFQALFDMYAEEDQKISRSGIKLFFRYMGECVTDEDVCQWLREVDKDHDGRFDFSEFCRLYSAKREPEDKRREELLMCVNTVFPTDGTANDMLDLRKVKAIMKRVNMGLQRENTLNLSNQEIDEVIGRFDTHKGNEISRREFVDFLINTSNGE